MTLFLMSLLSILIIADLLSRSGILPLSRNNGSITNDPQSKEPTVVINMPADAKPLAQLEEPGEKVVGGDRAVLWYSVYKAALDNPDHDSGEIFAITARKVADAAVEKVYGPLP